MWFLTSLMKKTLKMMVIISTKIESENSSVRWLSFNKESHISNRFVSISLISYLIVHRFSINVKTKAVGGDGATTGNTESEKRSRQNTTEKILLTKGRTTTAPNLIAEVITESKEEDEEDSSV